MDTEARNRMGSNGRFNPLRLATQFHVLLGMTLKKLFPSRFKGPAYVSMMTSTQPYSKVSLSSIADATGRNVHDSMWVD